MGEMHRSDLELIYTEHLLNMGLNYCINCIANSINLFKKFSIFMWTSRCPIKWRFRRM